MGRIAESCRFSGLLRMSEKAFIFRDAAVCIFQIATGGSS